MSCRGWAQGLTMSFMVFGLIGCGSDSGGGDGQSSEPGGSNTGGTASMAGASGEGGKASQQTGGGTTAPQGNMTNISNSSMGGAANQNPLLTQRCTTDDVCEADEFCRDATDDTEGFCVAGCRDGGCEEGQICNATSRVCIRDLSCEDNSGCRGGEYCTSDGQCANGCRIDDPEDCPFDEEGFPRKCDPATHTCVRTVVCCSAERTCSEELPNSETCGEVLPSPGTAQGVPPLVDLRGCFGNPDPCSLRCERNAQCAMGSYCNVDDGWCTKGCRIAGPAGLNGCPDDQVCNEQTRECERPSCDIDGDCPDDMYCSLDGDCLPGCRIDVAEGTDNCLGQNVFCTEARNCAPIEGVQPCNGDQFCVDAHSPGWYCENDAANPDCDGSTDCCKRPCIRHLDCGADLACITPEGSQFGRCAEGCRDDNLGDISTAENAHRLRFDGNRADLANGQLHICKRPNLFECQDNPNLACVPDYDWFVFEMPSNDMTINIDLLFVHNDGDLRFDLFRDPAGQSLVPTVNTETDGESLQLIATPAKPLPAGDYYIRVAAKGFDSNDYGLVVSLAPGLGPDAFEDDDAWQRATALDVAARRGYDQTQNRTIHTGDVDWYSFPVGLQDGFKVVLEPLRNDDGGAAELTFEIYSPSIRVNNEPLYGDGATAPDVNKQWNVPVDGNGNRRLGPDRCVAAMAGPEGCDVNDELPNGIRAVAFETAKDGFGSVSDIDGRWYIKVFAQNPEVRGRYRLSVEMDRKYVLCTDDVGEPNNMSGVAFDLMGIEALTQNRLGGGVEIRPNEVVTLENLNLCDALNFGSPTGPAVDQTDYYRVSLNQGDDLRVSLVRTEDDNPDRPGAQIVGSTYVEITDSNGSCVSEACDQNPNPNTKVVAIAQNVAAGDYYIRTGTAADTRTRYNLELDRTPGIVACDPDRFDAVAPGNQGRASAAVIMEGNQPGLRLCGSIRDEDWYRIDLAEESKITLNLTFSHNQGDLNMRIYSGDDFDAIVPPGLAQGEGGQSDTDNEQIVVSNRSPGTYYVQVYADGGRAGLPNVEYSLSVDLEERVYVCMDDAQEPNGSFDSPTELGPNVVANRGETRPDGQIVDNTQWLCDRNPADVDYYRFTVRETVSRVVGITFLYQDDGDAHIEVFQDGNRRVAAAQTKTFPRGKSKQCIIIPAVEDGNGCSDNPADNQPCDRVFYMAVTPRSISPDPGDEKLDYAVYVQNGEDCSMIPGDDGGVIWPRVMAQ